MSPAVVSGGDGLLRVGPSDGWWLACPLLLQLGGPRGPSHDALDLLQYLTAASYPSIFVSFCRTYRTANTCIDSCSSAECGPAYSARRNPITGQNGPLATCAAAWNSPVPYWTEVFRDCSDIRITRSGLTPTPAPTPRPTPAPTPGGTYRNPNSFCGVSATADKNVSFPMYVPFLPTR